MQTNWLFDIVSFLSVSKMYKNNIYNNIILHGSLSVRSVEIMRIEQSLNFFIWIIEMVSAVMYAGHI